MAPIMAIYIGDAVHTPVFGELVVLQAKAFGVDAEGKIAFVCDEDKLPPDLCPNVSINRLEDHQFLVPGLIDLHVHAPQYSYAGTATDKPLMLWLEAYTFPAESCLRDLKMARIVYQRVVERLLRLGTTTSVYFGTIHREPCQVLADIVEALGQRGYVGKVCMDQCAPKNYVEETKESIRETETFLQYIKAKDTTLVHGVITPRFTPTCTSKLMQGLAELAQRYDVHIQSHISESQDEVEFAAQVHGERDTCIFERCGLLTGKSLMAHGVHLTPEEWLKLRDRGTAIVHCPLSHFFFADGMPAIKEAVLHGVKVGLGTDVAGGYSPSMLNAIRNTVLMSRGCRHTSCSLGLIAAPTTSPALDASRSSYQETIERQNPDSNPNPITNSNSNPRHGANVALNYIEAFWLATMGGATALGIGHQVGSFAVGKAFDAILVSLPLAVPNPNSKCTQKSTDDPAYKNTCPTIPSPGLNPCSNQKPGPTCTPLKASAESHIDIFWTDSLEDRFQKFVNLGDERDIAAVWVQGRKVVG